MKYYEFGPAPYGHKENAYAKKLLVACILHRDDITVLRKKVRRPPLISPAIFVITIASHQSCCF
jgi:hypothetical protein